MKAETSIEELLRWRLARAEAEAPRPPRAARLLEEARPWWEVWPVRFQDAVERLSAIRLAVGHAMAEPPRATRTPARVPALILRGEEEAESSARVLYLRVEAGRLRLRLEIEDPSENTEPAYEATFVATETSEALFSARACLSVPSEYSIDAEIPPALAGQWQQLKVTDPMPFRLILRSGGSQ